MKWLLNTVIWFLGRGYRPSPAAQLHSELLDMIEGLDTELDAIESRVAMRIQRGPLRMFIAGEHMPDNDPSIYRAGELGDANRDQIQIRLYRERLSNLDRGLGKLAVSSLEKRKIEAQRLRNEVAKLGRKWGETRFK